jgi:hypothetical protein
VSSRDIEIKSGRGWVGSHVSSEQISRRDFQKVDAIETWFETVLTTIPSLPCSLFCQKCQDAVNLSHSQPTSPPNALWGHVEMGTRGCMGIKD